MTDVVLGTAHLFGLADPAASGRILEQAWERGVRRYDTAPSYGAGRSEPALGEFLAGREGVRSVTTKVGLAPPAGPASLRRVAVGAAKRLLPTGVVQRLRAGAQGSASGRFGADEVRGSVEESLRRLGGRVDRLMLHEVTPQDVDPELLSVLQGLLDSGDVGAVGVATQNHLTREAVDRGRGVLTCAHYAVGPLHPPVDLPASVVVRVGHGLLGTGGSHLRALQQVLDGDTDLAAAWDAAVTGTPFAAPDGLAQALLARAGTLDVPEVLVATTRVERLARTVELASGAVPLPPAVLGVLERAAAAARPTT